MTKDWYIWIKIINILETAMSSVINNNDKSKQKYVARGVLYIKKIMFQLRKDKILICQLKTI